MKTVGWLKRKDVRFILRFAILFILLNGWYALASPLYGPWIQSNMIVSVVTVIINTITPNILLIVKDNFIKISGSEDLIVGYGCDGVGVLIMMLCAMLALPGIKFLTRCGGVIFGIGALYFSNLLRITTLVYTAKYAPTAFDFIHVYVGQFIMIVIAIVIFVYWVTFVYKKKEV